MALPRGSRLGPYEILAPLGAGGMGEVYRARDGRLDRDVAIKVLPASTASDPIALSRFEREAKAVAALSHPNILAMFDFGKHDGISYAVTELLHGETLRSKLTGGSIPTKDAVGYALQIAHGLSAAHERGIVHRDLKPENVFLTKDGLIKVLDFGLAKRVEAAPSGRETSFPTATAHTEPGTILGTVGYMSPEQVRGLPVDHRSDIFSFGAILYELLSGRRAFERPTPADTMSAILKEEPPQLASAQPGAPVVLGRIVHHCLEKEPDNRFQSARDVAFALSDLSGPAAAFGDQPKRRSTWRRSGTLVAVFAITLAAIGLLLFSRHNRTGSGAAPIKRLAVLPFENVGSPDDDYFADGMADEIRSKLTSLAGVELIARGSSVTYKKTTKTPAQIGRELDARYLLTATVRWQKSAGGSRVLVTPELVELEETGAPASRWQQAFDASLTDVFQVQAEIAAKTAQALGLALGSEAEKRISEKPTRNLAAYDAFLKGEEVFKMQDREQEGLAFYEQAVALDPGFTKAWVGVSVASSWVYGTEQTSPELARRAREATDKVATLAPDGPESHFVRGVYLWMVTKRYREALEELEWGQRSAPADVDLLVARGAITSMLGRWPEAVELYRKAERIDPRSPDPKIFLGIALMSLHQFPEAGRVLEQGVSIAPAHTSLAGTRAIWFLTQGNLPGARKCLAALTRVLEPTQFVAFVASFVGPWVLDEQQRDLLLRLTPAAFENNRGRWGMCLAEICALRGDRSAARRYAEEASRSYEEELRTAPNHVDAHLQLAGAYAYLNRRNDAMREEERARALAPSRDGLAGVGVVGTQVRVFTVLGENDKAIERLETLLKMRSMLTPAWLKIDPNYDPLRANPRFQKLVAEK